MEQRLPVLIDEHTGSRLHKVRLHPCRIHALTPAPYPCRHTFWHTCNQVYVVSTSWEAAEIIFVSDVRTD